MPDARTRKKWIKNEEGSYETIQLKTPNRKVYFPMKKSASQHFHNALHQNVLKAEPALPPQAVSPQNNTCWTGHKPRGYLWPHACDHMQFVTTLWELLLQNISRLWPLLTTLLFPPWSNHYDLSPGSCPRSPYRFPCICSNSQFSMQQPLGGGGSFQNISQTAFPDSPSRWKGLKKRGVGGCIQ